MKHIATSMIPFILMVLRTSHGRTTGGGIPRSLIAPGKWLEDVDRSDPSHVARTWVVVLAYLLTDYRYLYF